VPPKKSCFCFKATHRFVVLSYSFTYRRCICFLITVTHRKAFCFWATRRKSELFQCTNRRGVSWKTTHRRAWKAWGCNIWSTAKIKVHKISRKWPQSTNMSYNDNCNIYVSSQVTYVYTRNFQTNHTTLEGAIPPSPIARLTRSETTVTDWSTWSINKTVILRMAVKYCFADVTR